MTRRTSIAWITAAALFAAFFSIKAWLPRDAAEAPKAAAAPDLFPFVRSFDGTRPDGDLKVAVDDTLIVDPELRRLFDYYLGAYGEKTLVAIRIEIELELDRRLKPQAAALAKRLLARYLDYKLALVELEKNPALAGVTVDAIEARQSAMHRTRAQFFSTEEVQQMFGADDVDDADTVARLRIMQDRSLDAVQKQQKLTALDARMPAAMLQEREAPLKVGKMAELATKMRAEGGSEDDIYRMRAAAFTPEAAARLAEVDRNESMWQRRVAAYLVEREGLIRDGQAVPEGSTQAAQQQLRDLRFSADEQKRLWMH